MKADPPQRANGRCAGPGCNNPLRPAKPVTKDVPAEVYEQDPFCSATCCRAYHNCPIRTDRHNEFVSVS